MAQKKKLDDNQKETYKNIFGKWLWQGKDFHDTVYPSYEKKAQTAIEVRGEIFEVGTDFIRECEIKKSKGITLEAEEQKLFDFLNELIVAYYGNGYVSDINLDRDDAVLIKPLLAELIKDFKFLPTAHAMIKKASRMQNLIHTIKIHNQSYADGMIVVIAQIKESSDELDAIVKKIESKK